MQYYHETSNILIFYWIYLNKDTKNFSKILKVKKKNSNSVRNNENLHAIYLASMNEQVAYRGHCLRWLKGLVGAGPGGA